MVWGSAFVTDDLAANDHRVGCAGFADMHLAVVEQPTLRLARPARRVDSSEVTPQSWTVKFLLPGAES